MNENLPLFNQSKTGLLNWIFALVLVLVICAIGTVAWKCVDSLQKHSDRVQSYSGSGKEVSVSVTDTPLQNEMDKRVFSDKMDPMVAIQEPTAKGSEIPLTRAITNMGLGKFPGAAADLSLALLMIPAEAISQHAWHIGQSSFDKNMYVSFVYEQRGCCYMRTGQFPLAIRDLTASIKLRPDYVLNYQNRAKVYDLLGQKDLAAADKNKIQALSNRPAK